MQKKKKVRPNRNTNNFFIEYENDIPEELQALVGGRRAHFKIISM